LRAVLSLWADRKVDLQVDLLADLRVDLRQLWQDRHRLYLLSLVD
jgi:hypothetical protein